MGRFTISIGWLVLCVTLCCYVVRHAAASDVVAAPAQQFYWHNEITGKTQWEDPHAAYKDDKGNEYYIDPQTKQATWEKPEECAWHPVPSQEHDRDYYYNERTGVSTWDKPEYLAWRKVAASGSA